MRTERLLIKLHNHGILPPFLKHHYLEVLRMPLPDVPSYPAEFTLEFLEKGGAQMLAKLQDALARRRWDEFGTKVVVPKQPKSTSFGLEGYFQKQKEATAETRGMINKSFANLNALRDSASKLVPPPPSSSPGLPR